MTAFLRISSEVQWGQRTASMAISLRQNGQILTVGSQAARFLFLSEIRQLVDPFDQEKDDKGHDQKIDYSGNKRAVIKGSDP